MKLEFTPEQEQAGLRFRAFAAAEIVPFADDWDRNESLPPEMVSRLASSGYLASMLPPEWNASGFDTISYGLLHESIGAACSSVRSLLTVHDMVAAAILRWGTTQQRQRLLPQLARGELLAAFAISEPEIGSDAAQVQTTFTRTSHGAYRLDGKKKWITFGQIADLFLVLGQCEGRPTTFLVERTRPGFSSKPIRGLLGTKAAMLAELSFENCEIPAENLLGRVGFGLLSAVSTGLGLGRYSVAWGCTGIVAACLDACLDYTSRRKQGGVLLKDHQLIQEMLTDMATNLKAARLLCCQAGYDKSTNDPGEISATFTAKYFAARSAMQAALSAVQIHGAIGCSSESPVQRYLRDAKIMEIIEGSTQVQQITLAGFAHQEHAQRGQEMVGRSWA